MGIEDVTCCGCGSIESTINMHKVGDHWYCTECYDHFDEYGDDDE